MLKITDLSYRYQSRGSFTLQKINLQLAEGEMLLLAGRSGCGKSTLIKAISGLLGSDGTGELQGSIYLNGEDTTYWPPERIGRLAGTVYQSPDDQLFAMTVADEVGFALENQGQAPETVKRQVSEALRLVGLAGFEDYSIHKLSGGP
uniref:ABC transporter ATP-binding protein n=1 Tax=uncultured Phascolarctobacterium sp. TaxID=512296 RepID=UPI0025CE4D4C